MKNKTTTYKWAYLPFVFSSAAIIATQASANPAGQHYKDAKQVGSVNHEYVGGDHSIGFGVDDEGNVDAQLNAAISRSNEHRTGVGLWAGYDLKGDDQGILGRGGQINHAWVSKNAKGQVTHVNKAFAAYDRNEAGHERATVGYGQENENLFWDGRVSKGLSGNKRTNAITGVSERAYDWGVGATVGKFLPDANARIRAGIDHEWSDKVGVGEKNARNTTLSAGIEKFFHGTGHSLSLDVAGSDRSGGAGSDDSDFSGRLGYRYDFGGASVYQPDRRYRRVRVEVPGKATPPRYAQKQQYKKVPTYKTVPVYGNKTVRVPTRQLVKSTMELEGQTFFKLNSSKLIPSAQARLKQIAAQIRKTGYKGSIRITGNTCGLGDARYDQILSEKRANEVRNFLIKHGFNPDHLIARGLGKGHPKYPRTPDQDFKNRRVDIEYVSQQQTVKTGYRNETKRVQTGTRRVATGFKNVPAGTKNVMISSGQPGAPRVIWKTEAIPTSPAWIQRALNNNIKHNTNINTYTTTFGSDPVVEPVKPEAVNDSETTAINTPVTIDVLGNDTSNSGSNQLTITSVGNPANGTAEIVNGQIVYTPNDGFVGKDTFTYTITDSNGLTETATVSVVVEGDKPEAVNDSDSTSLNTPVTLDVLSNDTSNSGSNQLTITSVGNPSNGTATIVNGKIVYTPNAGFVGTDSFTYTITDSNGDTATATATVTVEGDKPVAQNDSDSTPLNTPVSLDVLDNDTSNSGSNQLTITSVGNPSNGTATIVNGEIVYTPDAGFVGTDSFTYTITDSNGDTATATATVTVEGDKPVAQNDSATTDEGESVTLDVLDNDTSNSGSNQLTITSVGNPSNGTATLVNGQIVYTPNAGFSGTDSFTYTITDSNGDTATATATVTVNDDPKPEAQNDSATTGEGDSVTLDVLDNDTSNSGSNQLTITNVGNPSNGTATLVNGQIVYTPNAGFSGTDSFTYTITDSNGETATATATITVTDDPKPEAQNDSATTDEDKPVTLDVLGNDTSNSGSGDLTITGVGTPSNGTAQIVAGQIVYTPNAGFSGTDSFTYTITDSNGETATATATVTVNEAPNKAPKAVNDTASTACSAITINVLNNDSDPDGDALSIVSVGNASLGDAMISADGMSIIYQPSNTCGKGGQYTGLDSFSYTISDGNGGTASANVSVDVKGVTSGGNSNAEPDDVMINEGETVTINALSNDAGNGLRIIAVDTPKKGTAKIVNNKIVYTAHPGQTGMDSFWYDIVDANGYNDSALIVVDIMDSCNAGPKCN